MAGDLKKIKDQRITFRGTFEKIGYFDGYKGKEKRILLVNVMDLSGNLMAKSLWFNYTKGFEQLGYLKRGDTVEFDGRCKEYTTGHLSYEGDNYVPFHDSYKISNPSKIKKI